MVFKYDIKERVISCSRRPLSEREANFIYSKDGFRLGIRKPFRTHGQLHTGTDFPSILLKFPHPKLLRMDQTNTCWEENRKMYHVSAQRQPNGSPEVHLAPHCCNCLVTASQDLACPKCTFTCLSIFIFSHTHCLLSREKGVISDLLGLATSQIFNNTIDFQQGSHTLVFCLQMFLQSVCVILRKPVDRVNLLSFQNLSIKQNGFIM